MISASKSSCEARIGEVRAKTLVIMGEKDPDFPDPAAEASYVAQCLNGETLIIPGAGHYPHTERPDITLPGIRFLP